jgi:aconitate hydratase
VAYALAGNITTDLKNQPIAKIGDSEIFLADIWPSVKEINEVLSKCLKPELFNARRAALKKGSDLWEALNISDSKNYDWSDISGFVKQPPFFTKGSVSSPPKMLIEKARILLLLGDGVTTDDISPAGRIQPRSIAGQYLQKLGVSLERLHTFGARRGHWEVMLRGAFTNPNLLNELAPEKKGGFTKAFPGGEITEILKASADYQKNGTSLMIIAGKNYGTGSSRDDAARSTRLLGVSVVIAESYERIHRSNLAAFGVMPLLFKPGESRKSLNLDGSETITISMAEDPPLTGELVNGSIERVNGERFDYNFISALRLEELSYFQCGGILPFLAYKLTTSNSF